MELAFALQRKSLPPVSREGCRVAFLSLQLTSTLEMSSLVVQLYRVHLSTLRAARGNDAPSWKKERNLCRIILARSR